MGTDTLLSFLFVFSGKGRRKEERNGRVFIITPFCLDAQDFCAVVVCLFVSLFCF
jgi:hypothetical protein